MSQIHCCLGEFCIHRKLLRVDFDSERICKWARSTWIELDRAFWSALLSAISERGGAGSGSWVPGWIFYTTCLMFLKAGCIFCATLLVFKKLLLQKWAHFSVYYYIWIYLLREKVLKKPSKLTIKLALSEQIFCLNHLKCNILIQPLCAHIWWQYRKFWYLGCVITALFFYCFPAKLPEIFEQTVAFMGFVWAENCVSIKWNMETLCCPKITDNCPKQFLKYEQVQKLVIFDTPTVQSSHFGKSSKF